MLTLPAALAQAHYPDSEEMKERARRRLAFDELLVLQLALAARRSDGDRRPGIELPAFPEIVQSFVASLPFRLTESQESALREAMADVSTARRPMGRLLQGDVGSGKTVVALAMLLTAVAGERQGAMMAPTEVLAEAALPERAPTPLRRGTSPSTTRTGSPPTSRGASGRSRSACSRAARGRRLGAS